VVARKPQLHAAGYTVVEVLIVLGITAMMLTTAIMFVGGQQNRTQFTESVRDFQTKLQLAISDVSTNTYSIPDGRSCTFIGDTLTIRDTSGQTGQNPDCIIIGKVIHVHETGMKLYPLIGRRLRVPNGPPSTIYSQAAPAVSDSLPSDDYVLRGGLQVSRVLLDPSTSTPPSYVLGIVTSLNGIGAITGSTTARGDYNETSKSYNTGAQSITLTMIGSRGRVPQSGVTATEVNTALNGTTNNLFSLDAPQPPAIPGGRYVICLVDGNQYASVALSGSGASPQVITEIGGTVCS
jgi:type II secretory pathway pseudopilin PulG